MNSQPVPIGNVEDDPKTKAEFIFASDILIDERDVQDKAVSNLGYQIFAFTIDQFQQYLQKKKAGLAALGEWKHINCLKSSTNEYIRDDILMKLAGQNIEVNDSLKSGLLSGIDEDAQPMATQFMDNSQPIRDFPGGTISFLFEKCSKAELDDNMDE